MRRTIFCFTFSQEWEHVVRFYTASFLHNLVSASYDCDSVCCLFEIALFVLCLMTVMVVMVANASPTNMEGGYYNSLTAVGSQCGRGKGGRFHLGKASVAENGDGDGEAQNKGNLSLDPRDLNCTSGSGCVLFNVCGSLSTHTIDLQISNLDADSEGITYVWLSFNGTYAMKRNPKDLIIADLYSSPTKMLGCPPAAPAKNVGSWYIPVRPFLLILSVPSFALT